MLGWIRTTRTEVGRGGALVTAYDHRAEAQLPPPRDGTIDEQPLWDNLRYFLERVIPVAEEAGVVLAMHPDDPPVSPIRGVARIMRSPAAFERLIDLVPSPANSITLCQGNFTLMTPDLPKVIRNFGAAGKIAFVHFRDVRGTAQDFVETLEGDHADVAGYSELGRLHAIGYMAGLREAALQEGNESNNALLP
jgi:mannonate dehydratase